MTVSELHKNLRAFLAENEIEDSAMEARYIIQKILDINYSSFFLKSAENISHEAEKAAVLLAERRVSGEPIQYILGEWDFMGYTYKVGDGVLIPRPETELLCEFVLEQIANVDSPVIFDLCSGSGCIGISIKKERPDAKVILVEKSEKALYYLRENSNNICRGNEPQIICGDILVIDNFKALPEADVIISNPPYIRSDEIPTLQKEVQREPKMALDGGEDGLVFYRYLVSHWSQKLRNDGFMAFECGEDQSDDIKNLFSEIGFDSTALNDYNNIQRIVVGRRKP